MTNSQISELLFRDEPGRDGARRNEHAAQAAGNRSLRRLWDNAFVERKRIVLTSRRTGGPYISFVNILTAAGAAAVEAFYEEEDRGRQARWTPGTGEVGPQQIAHAIAINDVHALIRRAAPRRQMRLAYWRDDRQLSAMNRQGETHFVSIPDAFFLLTSPSKRHLAHFLEVDQGTESVLATSEGRRDWRAKIAGYETYFRTRYSAEDVFEGLEAPIVVTVTTSRKRLERMLEATAAAGGAPGRYWYTTLDDLTPPPPDDAALGALTEQERAERQRQRPEAFWQPIWRVNGEPVAASLDRRFGR